MTVKITLIRQTIHKRNSGSTVTYNAQAQLILEITSSFKMPMQVIWRLFNLKDYILFHIRSYGRDSTYTASKLLIETLFYFTSYSKKTPMKIVVELSNSLIECHSCFHKILVYVYDREYNTQLYCNWFKVHVADRACLEKMTETQRFGSGFRSPQTQRFDIFNASLNEHGVVLVTCTHVLPIKEHELVTCIIETVVKF